MPRPKRKAASGFSLLSRRPPDEDEQLAQARFELTKLETQYIEAAKAVDKLSQTRKGLSIRNRRNAVDLIRGYSHLIFSCGHGK